MLQAVVAFFSTLLAGAFPAEHAVAGIGGKMILLNRSAIVVVPKQPFLDWLRGVDAANTELTLDDLAAEPTIYLLPAYDSEEAMTEYLSEVYADIFEEELNGWHSDDSVWPRDPAFEMFCLWFDYRFHPMLVDVCDEPLAEEEV